MKQKGKKEKATERERTFVNTLFVCCTVFQVMTVTSNYVLSKYLRRAIISDREEKLKLKCMKAHFAFS